jgi:putative ABC transport system ATP-binding protein
MTAKHNVVNKNNPLLCELKNVVKTYRSGEIVCPVNGVSLKCEAGDFICIEGYSGIGKSTLLYLIGGLLQVDNGEIWVNNTNLQTVTDRVLTILRATTMGFIFQETNLFQALTVRENLAFSLNLNNKYKKGQLSKSDADQKINTYLERLGIGDRQGFLPHQLSVGQKRRLVVARALITEPMLVLADEPTNDLDDFWSTEVMKLLQTVTTRGGAVMMVTHNMKWAECANYRYTMNQGVLVRK